MIKLTAIIPTCEPDSMFEFLLPTAIRLKSLVNLLEFNLVFQPPYTTTQIDKVVSELQNIGFKVNYYYKDYKVVKPYTPLLKMRNDCSLLSPKSDYYLIWDDDISIEDESACNYILDAISKMDENSNLAAISLYNQPIENHRENFYSTNAGLIVRGGKYYGFDGYMPENLKQFGNVKTLYEYQNENLINLFGGFQDKFGVMCRLCSGQSGEAIINVPINHVENRKQKGSIAHGWDEAKYEKGSIANFIQTYFNPRFLETHSLTLFDKNLNKQIYPYQYNSDGTKKFEYDLYDNRGFTWKFVLNNFELFLKNYNVDKEEYLEKIRQHPEQDPFGVYHRVMLERANGNDLY